MTDTTAMHADNSSPRIYKILLMVLPVGVVLGTIIFMFMYFYLEREDEKNHAVIVSHGLRVSDLEDMVGKFTSRIGLREIETEAGRAGLLRAASMIEGRLGPQNVGYPVRRSEGEAAHGLLWKNLSVEILGEEKPQEVIFAAVSYAGAGEDADANTVSTMMMLASSMAREKPARTIRFVFMPFNEAPHDQNQWLLTRCLKSGESCSGIIGLQAMGEIPSAGGEAWQMNSSSPIDIAWWNSLREGSSAMKSTGGVVPSVWLTHPVYSSQTWTGNKDLRLDRTLIAAQDLRKWLLKASQ